MPEADLSEVAEQIKKQQIELAEKTNYADMVAKLAKSGEEILPTFTPQDCHLIHMLMGIGGEYEELVTNTGRENFIEELGDLEFYLEGMRQYFGFTYEQVRNGLENSTDEQPKYGVPAIISRMTDWVKRQTVYRKQMDPQIMLKHMRALEQELLVFRAIHSVTRDECLQANKLKLIKRYPGYNYSDQAAIARADKPAGE